MRCGLGTGTCTGLDEAREMSDEIATSLSRDTERRHSMTPCEPQRGGLDFSSPMRSLGVLCLIASSAHVQAVCSDSCESANDGICADGGPHTVYFDCDLGTDCTDCGPRDGADAGASLPSPPPSSQPAAPASVSVCDDSCFSANDGICADGGPHTVYFDCALGTDCTDCGPRDGASFPSSVSRAVSQASPGNTEVPPAHQNAMQVRVVYTCLAAHRDTHSLCART